MFDGKKSFSWFTDSPQQLFDTLLNRKYKNYIVYAHNLSRFDVVFILFLILNIKLRQNIFQH